MIKPPLCVFLTLRHEVKPENLLNLSRLPTRELATCRPTWAGHGVKVSWLGRP